MPPTRGQKAARTRQRDARRVADDRSHTPDEERRARHDNGEYSEDEEVDGNDNPAGNGNAGNQAGAGNQGNANINNIPNANPLGNPPAVNPPAPLQFVIVVGGEIPPGAVPLSSLNPYGYPNVGYAVAINSLRQASGLSNSQHALPVSAQAITQAFPGCQVLNPAGITFSQDQQAHAMGPGVGYGAQVGAGVGYGANVGASGGYGAQQGAGGGHGFGGMAQYGANQQHGYGALPGGNQAPHQLGALPGNQAPPFQPQGFHPYYNQGGLGLNPAGYNNYAEFDDNRELASLSPDHQRLVQDAFLGGNRTQIIMIAQNRFKVQNLVKLDVNTPSAQEDVYALDRMMNRQTLKAENKAFGKDNTIYVSCMLKYIGYCGAFFGSQAPMLVSYLTLFLNRVITLSKKYKWPEVLKLAMHHHAQRIDGGLLNSTRKDWTIDPADITEFLDGHNLPLSTSATSSTTTPLANRITSRSRDPNNNTVRCLRFNSEGGCRDEGCHRRHEGVEGQAEPANRPPRRGGAGATGGRQ